ncbi:type III-B CRISPR module-associated protein Cmr3 [Candidatus Hakubella thermalkaliphila]|uniref:CRISPR-associated protein Cmr3 n=1 Tax=Candidatus Hakubella thermalkaliphila TaxID=2754717 RepID=A0A6V8P420_9ACTN|nr:type III-B CRISPR module-associated protein Cmr3 [Candidatus Hakubella thermalkaliphila]GFP27359.1 CRISPR-associated protein Cmr3 [Candidatus Hakubella thermalkaliphila]
MRLFIRPLDTQFYRDGRPFEAGIEAEALSTFPPYPRTIYGALRACILSHHLSHVWGTNWTDKGLKTVVGTPSTPSSLGSLTIRGPMVARDLTGDGTNIQIFYPAPRDLAKSKDTDTYILVSPRMDQAPLTKISDLTYSGLYPCGSETTLRLEESERLLSHDYLVPYLTGQPPQLPKIHNPIHIYQMEPRIGIGLSRLRRTIEIGLLYAVPYVRMQDESQAQGGLVVEVAGDDGLLPESGFLRLGGDSRPAEYKKVGNIDWDPVLNAVRAKIMETGRFKAYLITPSIFNKGWFPDFLSVQTNGLIGNLPGTTLKVQLLGACVGRAIPIGGFDLVAGHPKPIQKAVPAGSVYFFKFQDWRAWDGATRRGNVDQLLDNLFYQSLTDRTNPQRSWKEGFGLNLIGGW